MRDLLLGLSIGIAAGISPGPLMVLVVTSALRSGWRAGVACALAPLVTDALVVLLVLFALDHVPERALYWLGAVGGIYVIHLGYSTLRGAAGATLDLDGPAGTGAALGRASIVNLSSPHPWLTWATALGPLTVATARRGVGGAVWLVLGFYLALVGAKVVVALLVSGTRHRLSARGYRTALRAAGVLLLLVGVLLVVRFGGTALAGQAGAPR